MKKIQKKLDESIRKKIVIVGDCHCGKTSLLYAFSNRQFLNEHQPTIIDTVVKTIDCENQKVNTIIKNFHLIFF